MYLCTATWVRQEFSRVTGMPMVLISFFWGEVMPLMLNWFDPSLARSCNFQFRLVSDFFNICLWRGKLC